MTLVGARAPSPEPSRCGSPRTVERRLAIEEAKLVSGTPWFSWEAPSPACAGFGQAAHHRAL